MNIRSLVCGLLFVINFYQVSSAQGHSFASSYGKLPLAFEPNEGQANPAAKFISRSSGYTVFLTANGASLNLVSPKTNSVMHMRLLGKNPHASMVGIDSLPGKNNYFIGNDPAKWRSNVPTFAKVKYQNVYNGVDLVYYGSQRHLEYDFIVKPRAKTSQIQLRLDLPKDKNGKCGPMERDGDLAVSTDAGQLLLRKPYVYQPGDGGGLLTNKEISGQYVILSSRKSRSSCTVTLGFQLAQYQMDKPVIIDPILEYSTYLGGISSDQATGIAVDTAGNAYITGETRSLNFPSSGGVQAGLNGIGDAFVTKLDPSGSAIVYSTFIGGSAFDRANGIAIDSSGSAYITGQTFSGDFPTTASSFQPKGPFDVPAAFVTKLSPSGSAMVFSTYLDGSGASQGNAITVDSNGNVLVAGSTESSDFPVKNAVQTSFAGGSNVLGDAFITKLTPDGASLTYSTYFGGSGDDTALGLAIDSMGNAYIAGRTESPDFPATGSAVEPTYGGGSLDGFAAKFSPSGSLIYATFLGGSNIDVATAVAADSDGNTYVGGFTVSTNFPTIPGSLQTVFTGIGDSFISKLNPSGSALVYSTLLGGSNSVRINALTLDAVGNVYVTGATDSVDFPTACPTQPVNHGGEFDTFVAQLNSSGSALLFSTFFGGLESDVGLGIALDVSSPPNIYFVGKTSSADLPVLNALQANFQGGDLDGFVAKIKPTSIASTTTSLVSSVNPAIVGQNVTFTANVGPACGSVGAATGTVTFSEGTNTLGAGTLASGQSSFSTTALSAGSHSITAAYSGDSNFNPSTSSVLTEVVEFNVCVLYDPTRSVHSGATFPIKLELCDAHGNNMSSSGTVVHATQIASTSGFSGPADDSGNANPDNDFRFTDFGYIFNLSTKGLASGTYMLQFNAGSDPVTHAVNFGVK
jgi:hypothetical protein